MTVEERKQLRMEGANARIIIENCHRLLMSRFRVVSLWSLVSHITGHGCGCSSEICISANLDPNQSCRNEVLLDYAGRKGAPVPQDTPDPANDVEPHLAPAWLSDPAAVAAVRLPIAVADMVELLRTVETQAVRRGLYAYVEQVGEWMVATAKPKAARAAGGGV